MSHGIQPYSPPMFEAPYTLDDFTNRNIWGLHPGRPSVHTVTVTKTGLSIVSLNHGWGTLFLSIPGVTTRGTFFPDAASGILDIRATFENFISGGNTVAPNRYDRIMMVLHKIPQSTNLALGLMYGPRALADTDGAEAVRIDLNTKPAAPLVNVNFGTNAYQNNVPIIFRIKLGEVAQGGDPAGQPEIQHKFGSIDINSGGIVYGGAIGPATTMEYLGEVLGFHLTAGMWSIADGNGSVKLTKIELLEGYYIP